VRRRRGYSGEPDFPGSNLTSEEVRFGSAMDRFKRMYRRPHPTCSETLAVLRSLGYRLVAEPGPIELPRESDYRGVE
jgi:hypothetical protein